MKKIVGLILALVLILSAVTASALVLKEGSTGTDVSNLQSKLKALGYYKDTVDGKYGSSTWQAVWWYQKDKGLKVDGIAGSQTLGSLGLSAALSVTNLKYGSSGDAVRALQNALKKLGYYKANVDGKYQDATWKAVWLFQRDKGLFPDGLAGSMTLSTLGLTAGSGYAIPGTTAAKLEYNASGSTVRALQTALKNRGYYKGTVDGSYGDETWKAVWLFQRDNGLSTDGIAGSDVLSLLKVQYTTSTASSLPGGKTLTVGSSGSAVWTVQNALKNKGYYKGALDSQYGNSTWEAVWWFQRNNGIPADGKVGVTTWNKLIN